MPTSPPLPPHAFLQAVLENEGTFEWYIYFSVFSKLGSPCGEARQKGAFHRMIGKKKRPPRPPHVFLQAVLANEGKFEWYAYDFVFATTLFCMRRGGSGGHVSEDEKKKTALSFCGVSCMSE